MLLTEQDQRALLIALEFAKNPKVPRTTTDIANALNVKRYADRYDVMTCMERMADRDLLQRNDAIQHRYELNGKINNISLYDVLYAAQLPDFPIPDSLQPLYRQIEQLMKIIHLSELMGR